jgi:hypothetical protein
VRFRFIGTVQGVNEVRFDGSLHLHNKSTCDLASNRHVCCGTNVGTNEVHLILAHVPFKRALNTKVVPVPVAVLVVLMVLVIVVV